jgi:hypothetical protein
MLTPDGHRAIEELRPGDKVLARSEYDPTGALEVKEVEEVFVRLAAVLHLHVGGQVIGTTAEHPFYERVKGWVAARELEAGDELSTHDGRWVLVEEMLDTGEVATVYNVRVADYHTYFVGARDWGFSVWAHNECRSYSKADPATKQDGERFVESARRWRNTIDAEYRGGVTIAVTEVNGVECVTLFANAGRQGRQMPQSEINAFRARVQAAGALYERASGTVHAEEMSHRANPEARAIGISNRNGPCPQCDTYFDQVGFYNIYWPSR